MRKKQTTHVRQKESQGEIATIHKPLIQWLRANKLLYVYHRPDKRSGIATGWPDFTICHCGRCLLIEAKTASGNLSEKQAECVAKLKTNGNTVVIARSASEAISAVQTWLGVEKAATEAPQREDQARRKLPKSKKEAAGFFKEVATRTPQGTKYKISVVRKPDRNSAVEAERSECPLDNERAAELIAVETDLSGCVDSRHAQSTEDSTHHRSKRNVDTAQNLWIAGIFGVDYVCGGESFPGGLMFKVRRATPKDIRDLPRK